MIKNAFLLFMGKSLIKVVGRGEAVLSAKKVQLRVCSGNYRPEAVLLGRDAGAQALELDVRGAGVGTQVGQLGTGQEGWGRWVESIVHGELSTVGFLLLLRPRCGRSLASQLPQETAVHAIPLWELACQR
jgi:hypothetical protein